MLFTQLFSTVPFQGLTVLFQAHTIRENRNGLGANLVSSSQ